MNLFRSADDWWIVSDDEEPLPLGALNSRSFVTVGGAVGPTPRSSNEIRAVPDSLVDDLRDRRAWHRWDDRELAALDECFAEVEAEPRRSPSENSSTASA